MHGADTETAVSEVQCSLLPGIICHCHVAHLLEREADSAVDSG